MNVIDWNQHHRKRCWSEQLFLLLLLLLSALLRFHDLGNIPRGLEHDEVATWHMVQGVLNGQHPLYFEEGYGHEPLYNYLTAMPMALFGSNWLGERFWAPWFGLFAVAATYALMRRLFGPLVGLGAAGLQGTVLWALFFNRLGLRLNLLPFLLAVAAYCFWRALSAQVANCESQVTSSKLGSRAPCLPLFWFVLSGLLIGLCFYTYMSSIVVFPLFATFLAYLVGQALWKTHGDWRHTLSRWWPAWVGLLVALMVMTPLILYRLNRPADAATPQRESQVDMPLREVRRGNLKPLLQNAWALIKMWNVKGELYWQLNVGSRPVLVEPVSGALFWLGLLIALWRWKEPPFAFLLLWIGWGMVPSLITSEAPSWPRTMLASPAALTLPAIAVVQLSHWIGRQSSIDHHKLQIIAHLTLVYMFLASFFLTWRDFLIRWPQHPRVRYAFQSSMTEAMRYLDAQPEACPVVFAGLSPHDMDPWTQASTLRRRDLDVRWVDTRQAVVIPPTDTLRLIVLDITPVDPALATWLELDSAPILAQGDLVPRGGREDEPGAPIYIAPAYTVYQLDAQRLKQHIARAIAGAGDNPFAPTPLPVAPRFGAPPENDELVEWLGYQWLSTPRTGAPAQLFTFWRALQTGPRSTRYGEPALKIFLHLLNGQGQVVGGVDTLGAAPDTWYPDDVIVQLHTFTYPTEPGRYAVELGWYVPLNGPRLTVGTPQERILLDPIEVHP